jgi:tyrosyl-DNA phosphodiesterase 2
MKRLKALFKIIEDEDPDFVCLQEVLPEFVSDLVTQSWVKKKYYISDISGETLGGYGVLMMSKYAPVNAQLWELPSEMGRELLTADFKVGEEVYRSSFLLLNL